ncbi:MAG: ATP-grasp domain-containing protein [Betaproteobacteria bacterium]|nr:ATP-grasp domain-containing protein [Betaproteobacteria bacterium]
MPTEIHIGITGFGGLDNPEPGVAVARALRAGWRGPLRITALVYDDRATGAFAPGLVDDIRILPPLSHGAPALAAAVHAWHAETPFNALMPCLDLEIPVYSHLGGYWAEQGIHTLLPDADALAAVDKRALPAFCHAWGIPTPRTLHVPVLSQVPVQAGLLGFPLFVKGTVAGGQRARDAHEASLRAAYLHAKWGGGVLLQQAIEGDEYVVAMVARGDGACLGAVAMKKLGLSRRGKGMVGTVVNDPALLDHARTILTRLRWRGPLELEFVRARSNGRFYLIEVNNRFPSWIYLSAFAGCNLPLHLLRETLKPGRPRAPEPQPGVAYARNVEEWSQPLEPLRALRRLGRAQPLPAVRPVFRRKEGGLRVGVTGVSTLDAVMAGLGVARALAESGEVAAIYGLAYSPYDTGIHLDDRFDATFLLPPDGRPAELLTRLLALHDQVGLDVVVPCLDYELPAFIAIREALEAAGIRTLLPSAAALAACQKDRLLMSAQTGAGSVVAIAPAQRAGSLEALRRAVRKLGFPLVLKGARTGVHFAYNAAEAETLWHELHAIGGEILAQSFLSGEEYAVAAVFDRKHRLVGQVTVKKRVQCEQGNTWGAVTVEQPELVHGLAALAQRMRWVGPMEGEFIRDRDNDRYLLLEINPRLPAWIAFSAEVGCNLPLLTVRLANNEEAQGNDPERDRLYLRCCVEHPADALSLATFAQTGEFRHG